MCYSVSPHKNKAFCNFLREQLSIPTDKSMVVSRWSLLINSRNMAKSAIHKLLTEILYVIKNLI